MNCDCDKGLSPDMISVDEFYPEVELEARGVPSNVVQLHVSEAAIEFAKETNVLVRYQSIRPQSCVADYYLTPYANEQISRPLSICIDGEERFLGGHNRPLAYWWRGNEWKFVPPFQLHVTPAPKNDCEECIVVKYSAMPVRNACDIDREFFDRYRNAILNGALARILRLERGAKDPYPFTDKPEAERRRHEFQSDKADAKTDVAFDYSSRGTSMFSRAQQDAGF